MTEFSGSKVVRCESCRSVLIPIARSPYGACWGSRFGQCPKELLVHLTKTERAANRHALWLENFPDATPIDHATYRISGLEGVWLKAGGASLKTGQVPAVKTNCGTIYACLLHTGKVFAFIKKDQGWKPVSTPGETNSMTPAF